MSTTVSKVSSLKLSLLSALFDVLELIGDVQVPRVGLEGELERVGRVVHSEDRERPVAGVERDVVRPPDPGLEHRALRPRKKLLSELVDPARAVVGPGPPNDLGVLDGVGEFQVLAG